MFLQDGRELAYMAGPLHFGLSCYREDTATGRKLANYDCSHDEPEPVPDWVKALP
jgi:hypothetical protein